MARVWIGVTEKVGEGDGWPGKIVRKIVFVKLHHFYRQVQRRILRCLADCLGIYDLMMQWLVAVGDGATEVTIICNRECCAGPEEI